MGLAAAGLAAIYPLLIVPDGALLSETLYGPVIILVLAAALALVRRPGTRWAAGLGLALGLAALVRSEAIGLVVLLALPLPIVVAVRLARTWGLFQPFRGISDPGRNVKSSNLGVLLYYPIAALAVVGAWALRRRRTELWVLLAPIVLVSLVSAITYGSLRPRYLAELSLVLLAAFGAGALRERREKTRGAAQPPAVPVSS